MGRALLFASTGIAYFVFWSVAHPSTEMTASMTEWPNVLWFTGTLAALLLFIAAGGPIQLVTWLAAAAAALVLARRRTTARAMLGA